MDIPFHPVWEPINSVHGRFEVFLTGSCWNDAYSMAAAIASLQLCKDNQAASSVMSKGKLFCDQLESISHKFGVPEDDRSSFHALPLD